MLWNVGEVHPVFDGRIHLSNLKSIKEAVTILQIAGGPVLDFSKGNYLFLSSCFCFLNGKYSILLFIKVT